MNAPDGDRISLHRYLLILVQLALLLLIIRQFQIESAAFLRISLLAFAGFAVHYFLPLALRLPFFVLLSLAGIAVIFGLPDGLWLIAIGLVLIGICHLPIALYQRVLLLLATGGLLAGLRMEFVSTPWSQAIWPILGSMFMFRLMVYLYDIEHDRAPVSGWRTLGYFFLLPNVCFPLFPVVDYKTFRRNYFDAERHALYQQGVDWMFRGIIHLLLYRIIYQHFTLAPSEVVDTDTLTQFLVSNFLLYLRISGHFHLIVGMLYLFGFRLPETNHRYCLASSFTDFWRRINIYWKDFMLKVFYYPTYFYLKKLGPLPAIVLATVVVFFMTWLLHSYQWFWLRGTFPVTWQDGLFWGILGVLVVANSVHEHLRGRKRTLSPSSWTVRESLMLGLRSVATFAVIVVLWSLWTAESVSGWLALWSFAGDPTAEGRGGFPVVTVAIVLTLFTAAAVFGRTQRGQTSGGPVTAVLATPRWRFATPVSILLLAAIGVPQVYTNLGTDVANSVLSVRHDRLSRIDAAALQRGYYENITRVDRFNSQLWEVYANRPAGWLDVQGAGLQRFTGDFRQVELVPHAQTVRPFGSVTTNRWGMRGPDYDLKPPPDTYRVGLVGSSIVMGAGVDDHETFAVVLEERLNQDRAGGSYQRYELLNFGVPGYKPLQKLPVVERVFAFEPDAVFYFATGRESSRAADYLAEVVRKRINNPYPYLQDVASRAGLEPGMHHTELVRRLTPFREEILGWLYGEIARLCRDRGVSPVLVFLPQLERGAWEEETPATLRLAREHGFLVLDLSGIYDGYDTTLIQIADWDRHPNPIGHRLIADRLYELIRQHQDELFEHLAAGR
jgi:D-alanyl-lipoteichoic acid acyltransferase DltB (MBOAT superfamily)